MIKKTLLTFSTIGILISAYLAYSKLTNNPLICGLSNGCDIVQSSKYSLFLGIPLGIWGMGYYFGLFTAFYAEELSKFRWIMIIWGLLFSIYLTAIEAFVLYAYCLWCLGSLVNIIIITAIYGFQSMKTNKI